MHRTLHATRPLAWHDVPASWTFDASLLVVVVAALVIHAVGTVRRGRPLVGDGWNMAALVLALVALVSPLDRLADALFSAHMVQHMVLIFGVAPALAYGRPWRAWRHALPRRWNVGIARVVRAVRGDWTASLVSPMTATTCAVTMLWFWHVPAMYELAVEHASVHVVEHVALVVSWTALWTVTRREVRRGRIPTALAMLAVTSASGNALGMLLVFTAGEWYTVHEWTQSLGLSQAADQQLAGMIMWILPGFAVIVVMGRLFLHWLQPSHVAATVTTWPSDVA